MVRTHKKKVDNRAAHENEALKQSMARGAVKYEELFSLASISSRSLGSFVEYPEPEWIMSVEMPGVFRV